MYTFAVQKGACNIKLEAADIEALAQTVSLTVICHIESWLWPSTNHRTDPWS